MNEIYNENYTIKKFGHIKNKKLKDISTYDLENLIIKLAHDNLLVKAMKGVIKKRNTLNIEDELKALENNPKHKEAQAKKTTLDDKAPILPHFSMSEEMLAYAQEKFITRENALILFNDFVVYYRKKQYQSRDWNKLLVDWIDKNQGFVPKQSHPQNPQESTKQDPLEFTAPINGEKYPYIIEDFATYNKAVAVSDKIKDHLRFEKNIDWLEDYYWKQIPIEGIKWQKVRYVKLLKDEIILYFDSDKINQQNNDGLKPPNNKNNQEILDVEIISKELTFNEKKEKSNKIKEWVESQGIDWMKFYNRDEDIEFPNGVISCEKARNPDSNELEVLLYRKK